MTTNVPAILAKPSYEIETNLLASLPLPVKSRLSTRISDDYQREWLELRPGPNPSRQAIDTARQQVQAEMKPASHGQIVQELTKTLSVTASRSKAEIDLKAYLVVMAGELADLPADAVFEALAEWRKTERYWPTLAEIRAAAQAKCRQRQNLLRLLAKLQAEPEAKPQKPADVKPLSEANLRKLAEVWPEMAKKLATVAKTEQDCCKNETQEA